MKLLTAAVLGFSLFATTSAVAENSWATYNEGTSVVAADCGDCGDIPDTSMALACRGGGKPAMVTVYGVASDLGRDGADAPVRFNIDGQVFTYTAKTVYVERRGYAPQFALSANDPMIAAMKSGYTVIAKFSDRTHEISLKGSAAALKRFSAECGFQTASAKPVFGVQPGQKHTTPNADGVLWFTAAYEGKFSLTYGLPETDLIGFGAQCTRSGPITINAYTDHGNKRDGTSVPVNFDLGPLKFERTGKTFSSGGELVGVAITLAKDDQLIAALAKAPSVSFNVPGRPGQTGYPAPGVAGQFFLQQCR